MAAHFTLAIDKLAHVEFALYSGQAHDALAKLRMAIRAYASSVDFKRDNVRGQCAMTRAESVIHTFEQDEVSHRSVCLFGTSASWSSGR